MRGGVCRSHWRGEREARLRALRDVLLATIQAGGEVSDARIEAALDARAEMLKARGVAE